MEYWTAFTLGLFGSLHCIGMCGPIALSLPYQDATKFRTLLNVLIYNFGRTFTYTIIGVIPGLLGLGVFLSGYQTSLSIALGILFICIAVFSINLERQVLKLAWYKRFNTWLQAQFKLQFQKRTRTTLLSIGLLNGFLPCGMVYLAVAGAFTQSHILDSMLYMLFFGLGTFPLMVMMSFFGNWISLKFRKSLFKIAPFIIFFFGVLFLWRGLQIDLPTDINFWLVYGKQTMCF
ncbi:MAG: sulfite exporter TauE/SafE [Saprospiraceae bacterium]|jgi:sulfite exporter TauE/SafE